MRKKLRALAALAMVPVVFFVSPAHASGPWVPVVVSGGVGPVGPECEFNVQQFGGGSSALTVGSAGYCTGGPDTTPGFTQSGEAGSQVEATFSGTDPAGNACSGSVTWTLGQHPANGTIQTAGAIPGGPVNTSAADCSISKICLHWPGAGPTGLDDGCSDVSIPAVAPEPVTSACPFGTPSALIKTIVYSEGSSSYNYRMEVELTIAGETPPGVMWGFAGYANSGGTWSGSSGYQTRFDRLAGVTKIVLSSGKSVPKTDPAPGPWIHGFEINASLADWNNNSTAVHSLSTQMGASPYLPPGPTDKYGGWTDPTHCRFWFGPQVHNVEGTDGDLPAGEFNVPPTTQEPTYPEPTIDQPEPIEEPDTETGWLGGLWALLDWLKRFLNRLWDWLMGIMQALKDALKALFVPTKDGWKVEEVSDQLQAKPPFSVAAELEDQAQDFGSSFSSSGDCGVLATFGDTQLSCVWGASTPSYLLD